MSKEIEEKLNKIPVLKTILKVLKGIKLPGFNGLSLYDLLELYVLGIVEGTLTTRASAIAFSFFTAIFPFLLFVIVLMPYIPIDGFEKDFSDFLNSVLPPQTSDFFFSNIFQNISGNGNAGLISSVFLISILLMANGVNAVFTGFESSYHEQLTRNVFQQYLYAIGIALILALLVLITVASLGYFELYVVKPIYDSYTSVIKLDAGSSIMWFNVARYAFFVIMIYIATATLYFFGTKEGRQTKFFSIGALLTTLLVVLISYLFGVYVNKFSRYNELYGSIGALLILLLYLWLISNILLLGYELNATLRGLRKLKSTNSNY